MWGQTLERQAFATALGHDEMCLHPLYHKGKELAAMPVPQVSIQPEDHGFLVNVQCPVCLRRFPKTSEDLHRHVQQVYSNAPDYEPEEVGTFEKGERYEAEKEQVSCNGF